MHQPVANRLRVFPRLYKHNLSNSKCDLDKTTYKNCKKTIENFSVINYIEQEFFSISIRKYL